MHKNNRGSTHRFCLSLQIPNNIKTVTHVWTQNTTVHLLTSDMIRWRQQENHNFTPPSARICKSAIIKTISYNKSCAKLSQNKIQNINSYLLWQNHSINWHLFEAANLLAKMTFVFWINCQHYSINFSPKKFSVCPDLSLQLH